jgi:hypothetical protein
VAHLGGGGEDILLCKGADVFDVLGVRLSFRMAASAAPVLNCMDDCRRAPSLPVIEREGRGAGFQRSPKAGSGDEVFASRPLGGDPQTLSFLRNGEEVRNGDDGRNMGEEGMLMSGARKEAVVRLLEAEKSRPAYRGCDVSINHTPGGVFGKDLDRVVFRFSSTRHTLGDSESLWRTPGMVTHNSGWVESRTAAVSG